MPTRISIIWDLRHKLRQKIQEKAMRVWPSVLTAAEMESQMRTQKCPLAWLIKEAKLKSEGAPGAGEPDQQGAQDLLGCIIYS